jgi:hypothetical protein
MNLFGDNRWSRRPALKKYVMRMGVGGLIADALIVLEKIVENQRLDDKFEKRFERFLDLYTGPGTMSEPTKKFW